MNTEKMIRILAGALVLTGTALAFFLHNPWFLLIPAFVGANLVQSALTGFCPPEMLMRKLGVRSCCQRDR